MHIEYIYDLKTYKKVEVTFDEEQMDFRVFGIFFESWEKHKCSKFDKNCLKLFKFLKYNFKIFFFFWTILDD